MIRFHIATAVFTWEMAEEISKTAVAMGETASIHIKLDTGMSRIGFQTTKESLQIIKKIAALPGICIEGCFTHFARMDETDMSWSQKQLHSYLEFVSQMESEGIEIPIKHISNSAGIIQMPQANLDMVRDGISVYGLYPSEEVDKEKLPLEPAMELKAYVSHVKTLKAGTQISYGGTYITTRETRVATIPVGYADGYPRSLSGKGRVLIHGQSASVLGRICMDQFMVDVTDIPDVRQGDEVTLMGKDGEEFIPVEEVAKMAYSFNYEFVCDVGKRVPRIYYRHGKKIATKDYYPDF
jgi:alanine racemase